MPSSAAVTLPSDTTIEVVRDFAAPRSLVYLAFTRPELVGRWLLGPPGWTMPICEIDLRVGGHYHYRWEKADREGFGLQGTFDTIVPDAELDTRESFIGVEPAGEARIETSFTDEGIGTRVTYLITSASKERRDAALATGMTNGMEMSFQALDRVLAAGI
jgi:uncharacterized protein YndB with AHSA1/START domain